MIVVTGGEGFIGRRVCGKLRAIGERVCSLDVAGPTVGRAGHVPVSVLDPDAVESALQGATVIIHAAGPVADMKRGEEDERLQVEGTEIVLDKAVSVGVKRVIVASSFYVYEGAPDSVRVVDEYSELSWATRSPFARVKRRAEDLAKTYAVQGLEVVAVRIGSAYGGEGSTNVVDNFIASVCDGGPLEVWGDGTRVNQFTHVDDLAEGLVTLALRPADALLPVVNLINPERTTTGAVARMIANQMDVDVDFDLERPSGPSFPYMSASATIQALDWYPRSVADGLLVDDAVPC